MEDHRVEKMPPAPRFLDILGPSFILLGLGLGSGELILWPYLTSNFGLGIIWGAVLGITLQFFINMEVERYSLTKGESIFVGFARKTKLICYWFIFSTFLGFAWPGIIGSSAKLISEFAGIKESNIVAIILLILIGFILTLGPIVYKTVEKMAMILIAIAVPAIFALTLIIAKNFHWLSLAKGIVGIGDGYSFLPESIPIASFLAAFAFSGAGGNLNLAQSFYIKEKGYGMGKFSGRITSILTGSPEEIKLEGTRFEITKENLASFKNWWRLINVEHLIVFWGAGLFTICLLGLLSFASVYGKTTPAAGINFILYEALSIGEKTAPLIGKLFLLVGGIMLFSTQLTVMDATSRIMSENLLIIKRSFWHPKTLSRIYYSFLWAQILFGAIVFLTKFSEPLFLLTLSAVINAGAMFVHIALTLFINMKSLEKEVRPSLIRIAVMVFSFVFFGYLTVRTILEVI